MPEAILTILKFCFLALLYLFLFRVIRVVYLELGGRVRGTARAAPAPAPSGKRRGKGGPLVLKAVAPAEVKGRVWDIGEELTVGRAAACQVSLGDDTYVSQMHARVFRRDSEIFVEDLGSTNGTYLNRKKLTCEMPVHRGDRIQVGKTVLELAK
ncbi:MAG: FHA domain-containing protein [Actinobacteria bacterium]|nr:FHA domain-containing protein [Actinomycetota bacterium]